MLKKIALYIGHFLAVGLFLLVIAILIVVSQNGSISYGDNPLANKVDGEGPFVFFTKDQLETIYIKGNREQGFSIERQYHPIDRTVSAEVTFHGDDSAFQFDLVADIESPPSIYDDGQPIVAISDLEGNYKALRDFLIANNVIDENLAWAFNKGHLVLVGDLVDRGDSTTQLLWFVYKLEQEAAKVGGQVHYIIGNHEIKNMQGNFRSAANKYIPIAGMIGKSQADLFANDALIGRWLGSKNSVEMINGYIFVHGGIHPDVTDKGWRLTDINEVVRKYYRQFYYPGLTNQEEALLVSGKTGPAWYRGYFQEDISQTQIDAILKKFDAKALVVGHTIQFSVNSQFANKLFAIDVKHPDDYRSSFPTKYSEGLLIQNGEHYRLMSDGEREQLD